MDGAVALLAAANVPAILLGGLNEHTLKMANDTGAHGLAVMSAVFQAKDPERASRRLVEAAAR